MNEPDKFDEWALVELMGRQRIVGQVKEAILAGAAFIRVDVPAQLNKKGGVTETQPAFSRFFRPEAIYCISPVSAEVALELLKNCRNEPVARYELAQLAEKYSQGESAEEEETDLEEEER